jgi:phenylalanyl-tRNA synthetase beta chain
MRYAKENENCLTLDEENRECTKDMIVISDDKQLHGIGGIMGGLDSGCSLNTKNVFLETALFDPISVTKTGRHLKLQSDARYRFERGIDPKSTIEGIELATDLIVKASGGIVGSIIKDGDYIEKKTAILMTENDISKLISFSVINIAVFFSI